MRTGSSDVNLIRDVTRAIDGRLLLLHSNWQRYRYTKLERHRNGGLQSETGVPRLVGKSEDTLGRKVIRGRSLKRIVINQDEGNETIAKTIISRPMHQQPSHLHVVMANYF